MKKKLLKTFLLAAGLLVGTSAWATGTTAGNEENTIAWWTDWTDVYTLAGYGTYNMTFTTTNANDGTVYDTWSFFVTNGNDTHTNGGTAYMICRGDGYAYAGDKNSNDNPSVMSVSNTYSGSNLQAAMNGATVTITVTRRSANFTVVASVTPTNGDAAFTMTYSYLGGDATSDNLGLYFGVEKAYVSISTASKTMTDVAAATATGTAMKAYTKYEFIPYSSSYRAMLKAGGSWDKSSQMGGNSEKGWYINSNARYIIANLTTALEAGDVVTVYAQPRSSTTADYGIAIGTGYKTNMNVECNVRMFFPKESGSGRNAKQDTGVRYKLSYTVQEGDDLEGRTKLWIGLTASGYYLDVYAVNVTTDKFAEAVVPQQPTVKQSFDFSGFSVGEYTTNQIINNMFVGADDTYKSGIVESSQTIAGTAYTKALVLNAHDFGGGINGDDADVVSRKGCIMLRLPEGPGVVRIVNRCNGSGGYIYHVFSTATNTSRVRTTLYSNSNTTTEIAYTASDHRILYLYSAGPQMYIYKVEVVPQVSDVEVTSTGYATYVPSYDLDFSATDIKAYTVKVSEKGKATLTKVDNVPAGIPVLLYKDGGATEDIPVMTGAAAVSDNDLVAGTGVAVATTDGDYTNMILNKGEDGIGFYFANNQTVATNRAYLHIASSLAPTAAARMSIVFADETQGISTVETAKAPDGQTYNLAGQRVKNAVKGLYIVNGKKVIIK